MQLTIDGREEAPHPRLRPLSPQQHDIMLLARFQGGLIAPYQAGKVMHAARNPPRHPRDMSCRYCSSDGWDALKRLRRRGLIEKIGKGMYVINGM